MTRPSSADSPRIAVAVPADLRKHFFPPEVWSELCALGSVQTIDGDHRDTRAGIRLAASHDVLISCWGTPPIDAALLDAAPELRLLVHTGASVKPHVTDASWAAGVRVSQAGAAMANSVAEAALADTLALIHRLHRYDHALRGGASWQEAQQAPPKRELAASVVGVVGASRTGRAYIGMVRALGASVCVCDPYLDDAQARELGVRAVELDELLRGSHVVALHAPVLPETRHMLGARELALMPDHALLVNTARSWLVDQDALLAELRTGRLDAAFDVYDEEPVPLDHPLRELPNVLLAPHQAGWTIDAGRRAGEIVVAEVARYAAGEPLEHEITREMLARMG